MALHTHHLLPHRPTTTRLGGGHPLRQVGRCHQYPEQGSVVPVVVLQQLARMIHVRSVIPYEPYSLTFQLPPGSHQASDADLHPRDTI